MRADLKRPYDQLSNPVDITSEDFHNVMAWLKSHGAPTAIVTNDRATYPGGSYENIILLYLAPNKPPLALNAFIVMNDPQHAEFDIRMWSGYGNQNPLWLEKQYEPPVKLNEPPTAPLESLVGFQIWGDLYAVGKGDHAPIGFVFGPIPGVEDRGTFVKQGVLGPFGIMNAHWKKIA